MWVAPDGAGIVYATFNDSEVEEVQFEVYGQGEGADAYPGVSSMRYPKVRWWWWWMRLGRCPSWLVTRAHTHTLSQTG